MHKKLIATLVIFTLSMLAAACGGDGAHNSNNTNANSNANANRAASTTPDGVRTGPDGSEIRTETADGVTTETRTFTDSDSRVQKVVVTERDGRRTARVYYRNKTVRELPDGQVEQALEATADTLATLGEKGLDVTKDVASEVGDKAEDVGREVGDKAEDVGGAAVKGAKAAGSEAADKAEDAGDATVKGAKKAGKATAKGAKKVGGAIKDAVTP